MSLGMIHRYVPSYDCRRTIAYGAVREPRMRRVSLVARVPNSHPARGVDCSRSAAVVPGVRSRTVPVYASP